MKYLFSGESTAAMRLKKLHAVFFRSTENFIKNSVKNHTGGKVKRCVDLACGTGYTTGTLASVIDLSECVGLDNSPYFIERAREFLKNYDGVRFELQDITKIPFPVSDNDLIYARFILTHLGKPYWLH